MLGALILVMMSYATGAKWFVALRRITKIIAATLPLFALLFIPILFGLRELYPWTTPDALSGVAHERVLQKQAYLNVPFFIIRAIIYFATWIATSWFLRRWLERQDRAPNVKLTTWERRLSAGGLVAIAVTLTFAAFDWLMSLSPTWYSTIYGVYFFAGGFVAALALVALVARIAESSGRLTGIIAAEHYHALGKLLLTFVIVWAYIAFSQFLIIWIGDIPEKATWYATRMHGGWGGPGVALAIGNFGIPFLLLLWRGVTKNGAALAALGVWLLIMHYVDIYWLVLPQLHPNGMPPHWLDLAALVPIIGVGVGDGAAALRRTAAVPLGDPYIEASFRYDSAGPGG